MVQERYKWQAIVTMEVKLGYMKWGEQQVADISVLKLPMQAMLFLCITLTVRAWCAVTGNKSMVHTFHRNTEFLLLCSVNSDNILQKINSRYRYGYIMPCCHCLHTKRLNDCQRTGIWWRLLSPRPSEQNLCDYYETRHMDGVMLTIYILWDTWKILFENKLLIYQNKRSLCLQKYFRKCKAC